MDMKYKLDGLVQQWASKQHSIISGKPAECGHHYFSRRHEIIRYNLDNIIPLTIEEHNKVHSGEIKINIPEILEEILFKLKEQGLKNYLLENRLTLDDFYKREEKRLKAAINVNYETFNPEKYFNI